MKNIALTGNAKAGKGVVADYLATKYGYKVVSFARPVKVAVGRMVLAELGYRGNPDEAEAYQFVADHKDAVRPMLQAFGVAMRTLVDADYWADIAMATVEDWNASGFPVVIDDLRFPNEFQVSKDRGFLTGRVNRPKWHRSRTGDMLSPDVLAHESERYVADLPVDFELANEFDLTDLYQQVDTVLLRNYYARR